MERHRHTRWALVTSALLAGVSLASAHPAGAIAFASVTRDVGMRAAGVDRATAGRRGGARQPGNAAAPSEGSPESATNAHGATRGDGVIVQQHDGRDRRRAPDSRVVLAAARSRRCRPRPVSITAGERSVARSGAVFHDAHAPPAATPDAAGRRS
jgi:hypothetical protein